MSTYAIGDVQGCYDSLMALLEKIAYQPQQDTLWFAGDLVNRGPKSLECLRFIKQQPNVQVVLGNHDLHLIAMHLTGSNPKRKDTFDALIEAPDYEELLDWLQQQKILVYDQDLDFCMTHAGLPHIWNLQQARHYANELENLLTSDKVYDFVDNMYGDTPSGWSNGLKGLDRYRVITNYFTRMRFIDNNGQLELKTKTEAKKTPSGYKPWFEFESPIMQETQIIFGHWANIDGITGNSRAFALDTGCVWGKKLTALRLEDKERFQVPSSD